MESQNYKGLSMGSWRLCAKKDLELLLLTYSEYFLQKYTETNTESRHVVRKHATF